MLEVYVVIECRYARIDPMEFDCHNTTLIFWSTRTANFCRSRDSEKRAKQPFANGTAVAYLPRGAAAPISVGSSNTVALVLPGSSDHSRSKFQVLFVKGRLKIKYTQRSSGTISNADLMVFGSAQDLDLFARYAWRSTPGAGYCRWGIIRGLAV